MKHPATDTAIARAERPTFVVLGASNVARALPWVVAGTRRALGAPLSLLVATGRGRSYGAWAGLAGIARPGIVDCGLWDELARASSASAAGLDALVTDVGNDVLYGSDAAVIARWVESCLERLAGRAARTIVLTGLPIERLRELGPREFAFWRRVFFPARKLEFERLRATIEELQERLAELARAHGAHWLVPPRSWYGLDPIHVPRPGFPRAWGSILAPFDRGGGSEIGGPAARPGLGLRARLALGRSARVRCAGLTWVGAQPAARCPDGTTIALY